MQDRHTESLKSRREFLKTSARLSAIASVASFSSFALNACNKDSKDSAKLDSANIAQNLQGAKNTQIQNQGKNMNTNPQVWYITGASSGLGLELAKHVLAKGNKVTATSRKLSNIESKLGKKSENFLPLELSFSGDMKQKSLQI